MLRTDGVDADVIDIPVNLRLTGRRVLVVGAGRIAARKIAPLLAAGAMVTVVAPQCDDAVVDLIGTSGTIQRRPYVTGDLDGVWFVVEATGDPDVARAVAADAEAARVFCNAADQPEFCSATLPAVHRTGALSVTFSTGGRSPAVASWLRSEAAQYYGPDYAALVDLCAEVRHDVRSAGHRTESLDWRGALNSGILEEIRSGRMSQAKERLAAWLLSSSE